MTSNATIVARYDFEDGLIPSASTDLDTNSVAGTFQNGAGLVLTASTVGDNTASPFASSVATGDIDSNPDGAILLAACRPQISEDCG